MVVRPARVFADRAGYGFSLDALPVGRAGAWRIVLLRPRIAARCISASSG